MPGSRNQEKYKQNNPTGRKKKASEEKKNLLFTINKIRTRERQRKDGTESACDEAKGRSSSLC